MADHNDQKTIVREMRIDMDFAHTSQGRASFMLGMAQFAREGDRLGAIVCVIDLVPLPATKELIIQCTFRGCGTFDMHYPRDVTKDDRRTFFLDLVVTALERHQGDQWVAPLWGPRPFLAKADLADKLADLRLSEK